jgi:hypothetical protein
MKINVAFPPRAPITAIYLLQRCLLPFSWLMPAPAVRQNRFARKSFLGKPIYRFESDYNKNLIKMGALPVNMDNVSGWANLFAAYNNR